MQAERGCGWRLPAARRLDALSPPQPTDQPPARSWWVLDLGPAHQLICNHYTLRHDASTDFLRSWVLQVGAGMSVE